jgi:hypothetical protein
MAAETAELRNKVRRVKSHILDRFLKLADKVDANTLLDRSEKDLYQELMMTFARNVLPRSQEIGGDPDNQTPIPILNAFPTDNSNSKDSPPHKTN